MGKKKKHKKKPIKWKDLAVNALIATGSLSAE